MNSELPMVSINQLFVVVIKIREYCRSSMRDIKQ